MRDPCGEGEGQGQSKECSLSIAKFSARKFWPRFEQERLLLQPRELYGPFKSLGLLPQNAKSNLR